MRPTWLLVSFALHAAAIGVALGGGAYAASAARRAPRVELQSRSAQAPAVPEQAPLPEVQRQTQRVVVEAPLVDPQIVEPILPPDTSPSVAETPYAEPEPERSWSLVPVRAKAPVAEAVPAASPPVPASVGAIASPEVRAEPQADNPPPEYPEAERVRGHEGNVRVLVFVDENGLVRAAELIEASPHAGLNRAALRAVRAWRFTPARRDGAAIAGTTEVTIEFRLAER